MRRLIALALVIPLIGAALTIVPTAAACTTPHCQLGHCTLDFDPPDVRTLDIGSAGADCDLPLPTGPP